MSRRSYPSYVGRFPRGISPREKKHARKSGRITHHSRALLGIRKDGTVIKRGEPRLDPREQQKKDRKVKK